MVETIQDFELARQERLWDGMSLWVARRAQGGVYSLGYHAEMTLKAAYFRFRGLTPAHVVDRALLNTTEARARQLGVFTPPAGFHSLRFWRDTLIAERAAVGQSLQITLAHAIGRHVDVIHAQWQVEMRYRAPVSTLAHLEAVGAAVDWLDRNYDALYT